MFEKVFDSFRKVAESSLRAQQDMFKQWGQTLPWMTPPATGASAWTDSARKQWLESTTELLNQQREFLDSMYKSGISMIEQSFRGTSAQSPEDYQHMVEDLWRKLSELFKDQTEAHIREFQKAAEHWSAAETPKAKT